MASLAQHAGLILGDVIDGNITQGRILVQNCQLEVFVEVRPRSVEPKLNTGQATVLEAMSYDPETARAICRKAGYSQGSLSLVRQCLCDLADMRMVRRTKDGWSKL